MNGFSVKRFSNFGLLHRRNVVSALDVDLNKHSQTEILHMELRRLLIGDNNEKHKRRPASARYSTSKKIKCQSFDPIGAKWGKKISKMDIDIPKEKFNLDEALTVSIYQNDIELVSKLCNEFGGNPNKIRTPKKETALMLAAQHGDASMMQLLVKYGYDVENDINQCDIDQRTAGHHASMYNSGGNGIGTGIAIKLMFKFLLKYHCNFLMFDSNGFLILHYLCKYNHNEGLKYIISEKIYSNNMLLNTRTRKNIDSNVKNSTNNNNNNNSDHKKNNATTIMIAIEARSVECLNVLCDIAIETNDIKSVVDAAISDEMLKLCIRRRYYDVLSILLCTIKKCQDVDGVSIISFDMLVNLYEYAIASNCKIDKSNSESCIGVLTKWLHEERIHWQPHRLHSSQHKLFVCTQTDIDEKSCDQVEMKQLATKTDVDDECIVCNANDKDSNRLYHCNKCKYYVCQSCIDKKTKKSKAHTKNKPEFLHCLRLCDTNNDHLTMIKSLWKDEWNDKGFQRVFSETIQKNQITMMQYFVQHQHSKYTTMTQWNILHTIAYAVELDSTKSDYSYNVQCLKQFFMSHKHKLFEKSKAGNLPIHLACCTNNVEILKIIMDICKCNCDDHEYEHEYEYESKEDQFMEHLIINEPKQDKYWQYTPLMISILNNSIDCVKTLCDCGKTDITGYKATFPKYSALELSCHHNNIDIVKILISTIMKREFKKGKEKKKKTISPQTVNKLLTISKNGTKDKKCVTTLLSDIQVLFGGGIKKELIYGKIYELSKPNLNLNNSPKKLHRQEQKDSNVTRSTDYICEENHGKGAHLFESSLNSSYSYKSICCKCKSKQIKYQCNICHKWYCQTCAVLIKITSISSSSNHKSNLISGSLTNRSKIFKHAENLGAFCETASMDVIPILLASGMSINVQFKKNGKIYSNLLRIAVERNQVELIKLLQFYDFDLANINQEFSDNYTIYLLLCTQGHVECLQCIIKWLQPKQRAHRRFPLNAFATDKFGNNGLHCAVNSQNPEMVKCLLENIYFIDGDINHVGSNNDHDNKNKSNKKHKSKTNSKFEDKTGQAMLNQRNTLGETPFTLACKEKNLKIVKLLLEYGGTKMLTPTVENEEFAVYAASHTNNLFTLRYLLQIEDARKTVNVVGHPKHLWTPLMAAIATAKVESVELLCKDVLVDINNMKNCNGHTSLECAAYYGNNASIMRILLRTLLNRSNVSDWNSCQSFLPKRILLHLKSIAMSQQNSNVCTLLDTLIACYDRSNYKEIVLNLRYNVANIIGSGSDDDDRMSPNITMTTRNYTYLNIITSSLSQSSSNLIQNNNNNKHKKQNTYTNSNNINGVGGRWCVEEKLGSGAFGRVFRGIDLTSYDRRSDALKFISLNKMTGNRKKQRKIIEMILNEIDIVETINDRNVIKLLAYNLNVDNKGTVLLVFEYAEYGELYQFLRISVYFNHDIAKTYFEQILNALETCHNMGIIHRDLKPQNILLSSKYQIKIADFGLSTHDNDADNKRVLLVGTRGYMSPEIASPVCEYDDDFNVIGHSEITSACDLFSLGVILWQMVNGIESMPFDQALESDPKYVYIYNNDDKLFWKCHYNCRIGNNTIAATDVAIRKLLLRMFETDASERITITGIRDHNWYKMVTGYNGDSDFFQSTMENIRQQILVRQLGSPQLQQFSFDKSLQSSTATSKSNQLKSPRSPRSPRSPKSQFEFSQLKLSKNFASVKSYKISNPLVAIIIIGDYENSPLPSISQAKNDYLNIIRAYKCICKHDVVFAKSDNTIKHIDYKMPNIDKMECYDFKLRWIEGNDQYEITNFVENIQREILDKKEDEYHYDSLILIVTSHGNGEEKIYDSIGEHVELSFIFDQFNNKDCKYFRQKPKLYLLGTNKLEKTKPLSTSSNSIPNHTRDRNNNNCISPKIDASANNKKSKRKFNFNNDNKHNDLKTYTTQGYWCKIFCHLSQSKVQKKENKNGSIFVQCLTHVIEEMSKEAGPNVPVIVSLDDMMYGAREYMCKLLKLPNVEAVSLPKRDTIPYEIEFVINALHIVQNDDNSKSIDTANYQTNFKHLRYKWLTRQPFVSQNPLIVAMGISQYDDSPNLDCAISDYKNIEHAFHVCRGFSFVHFNRKNKIVHKRRRPRAGTLGTASTTNINETGVPSVQSAEQVSRSKHFKIKWNEKEIFKFNKKISQLISNPPNGEKYDCLIYFLSCHGDSGGIIYDSQENKIPLIAIFDTFSNQNCLALRNKPKIYVIEACRGPQRTKRYRNSALVVSNNSKNNVNVGTNNQETKMDQESNGLQLTQNVTTMTNGKVKTNKQSFDSNSKKSESTDSFGYGIGSQKSFNNNTFSNYSYNREIYANTDGFGVVEPLSKGAYMTRSICKCIENDNIFNQDFDNIMVQTRATLLKLMGVTDQCAAQVIEDRTHIPRKMFFKQCA